MPQIEVYPGLIRLTAPDLNRREKAANRRVDRPLMVSVTECEAEGGEQARQITGWSRRSRARMVSTMAELDLAPLLLAGDQPAMVTLTYPGCDGEVVEADRKAGRFHKCDERCYWPQVAPDGEVVKVHLTAFFKRFERAWGTSWAGLWKLEFQGRGAPHFHLLMVPPSGLARQDERAGYELRMVEWEASGKVGRRPYWRAQVGDGLPFREWLSTVWADIVGHPDPDQRALHLAAGTAVDYAEGDRARDPKRAAVYFGKHGAFAAKDYQHNVPELWKQSGKSVGRFWGYRGLSKVKGAATIDFDAMLLLGRTLRRYAARTKVWNPKTRAHEFRPVLSTRIRPRHTVAADGTVKPARDPGTGDILLDGDGVPAPHVRYRRQTVRARRMTGPMAAGFLLVNDGPAMARTLARVIETCGPSSARLPVGMRGSVADRVALLR